ncbi:NAD(+) hydrolase sarm1 isoform X3 [Neocloeon triangulifer]|uniref:NAD(+) hydrolase sarm1 isoform X3 n=1 Tax=Neocloeon triangulifer TaxID=2078957 RepID=UPI00286F069E|nr:NAD(+) hydrolase sarm1 isoform X3 [Neocloeon triangulifer]
MKGSFNGLSCDTLFVFLLMAMHAILSRKKQVTCSLCHRMSDFPSIEGSNETNDIAAAFENMKKKNSLISATGGPGGLVGRPPVASAVGLNQANQTTSTSAQSAAQQIVQSSSASSSSSRVAKRVQHTSSSSHLSHQVSELKASSVKSDLSELQSSISEMKNLSSVTTQQSSSNFRSAATALTSAAAGALNGVSDLLRSSIEQLDVEGDGLGDADCTNGEPIITFPEPETPTTPPAIGALTSPNLVVNSMALAGTNNSSTTASSEMKFEQKRVTSATKTKVVTDSFSAEQASSNSAEMRRLHTGEMSFQQQTAAAAVRARLEMEGVTAEKSAAIKQEQRSIKSSEVTQQETQNIAASSVRLQTDTFSSEKKAVSAQQQRQTVTSSGSIFSSNQEQHVSSSSSQSNFTSIVTKDVHTKSSSASVVSSAQMSSLVNGSSMLSVEDDNGAAVIEDLERLSLVSSQQDVERAIQKCTAYLSSQVPKLTQPAEAIPSLARVNELVRKAWAVPTHGHELGYSICNSLRTSGALNQLIENCIQSEANLRFSSATLLEQILTTENRAHVVQHGLQKVVSVACNSTKTYNTVEHSRVGTGILEHLFKHSESTCSEVVRLGGLDAVLFECRKNDVETLRHCAGALANLSLYGGADNQEAMIKRKVPMWLFPLAFHDDDNIKYYACLAIAVLVANKEIEAAVLKSGTLDLVEPFVCSHNPSEFAKSNLAHAHGQSKNWLQRLVPVLSSKREEARNLAAFHFCMEAGIKKQQNNSEIFKEIGAIEPLKKVASCPNAVASKYAAQALRLMGEEVPHKLSQQVPLWSSEDVREWVKQTGFTEYAQNFVESRVDGDLLLQLTENNLCDDIGITNGIRRRRFTRELQNLKKLADYSSKDVSNLNSFLQNIAVEFSIYTYSMLNAGVDRDSIRNLTEAQLSNECGISNSIHRQRILESIGGMESVVSSSHEDLAKPLDVFVSYRRSNGSQLASLLKVHLQLRGFSVFIDVERLEAGKFDNNLLQSIRNAKHFLLVLTPNALDRCIQDTECKDWVHREIVAALQSQCNIVPIIDNFGWPEPEELPEDMRAVCHFNGVRWIHDYQDACVDKLERFLKGEMNLRGGGVPASLKGENTPSTPNSTIGRHPPTFQRTLSSDSGKGSESSKDINGNSGNSGHRRD